MDLKASDWIAVASGFVALAALVVSILFGRSTRRYAREQIELARRQFVADKTPDVEVQVFCQVRKPDSDDRALGLFLQVTNHSTTITVNQLQVSLTVEPIGDCRGFSFMFFPLPDLKPTQKIKIESLQPFEKVIPEIFPDNTAGEAIIVNSEFSSLEEYERYPASVSIEFLPRIAGSTKVHQTQEMYLLVERRNI